MSKKNNLVLLHGWGFDSRIWQPILAELEASYQVFNFDLPGFGAREPLTAAFTLDKIVNSLAQELPENADYLGWSLGGLVAIKIAERFPAKVGKLFLAATTPKFVATADGWPGIEPGFFTKFCEQVKTKRSKAIAEFVALQCPLNTQFKELNRQLRGLFTQERVEVLLKGLKLLAEVDLRESLAKLAEGELMHVGFGDKCFSGSVSSCTASDKIKFIFGSEDKLIPAKLANHFNVNTTVIEGAAHAPFWTHPQEFLACLK